MPDEAFSLRSTLWDIEESSLFNIAYVTLKEGLTLKDAVDDSNPFKNPEFLLLLSRVKYKNVKKTCINHLLIGFNKIYESCKLEYESCKFIFRRFSNCFSEVFSNDKSNKLTERKKKGVKRSRVSYKWVIKSWLCRVYSQYMIISEN